MESSNLTAEEIIAQKRAAREQEEQSKPELSKEETKAQAPLRAHDQQDHILQFFTYENLPEPLRSVSEPFVHLARAVSQNLPRNPERTVCLRKLLEAKDAAVRTLIGN